MSFFWPIAAGATLFSLLGAGGKDEGEEAQSELTDVQKELAKLMLEQYKSRFANEEHYMPEALKTTFDYTKNTLNRPRNVVWGKGIFEPTLQPRKTYDITTPEWNTFTPSEPPDLPPPVDPAPGPTPPGGANPGQPPPGGGTGPANMPPGLGWVSPGSVHTDDPSDGLAVGPSGAALWPMTPHMSDDPNKIVGPANWNPLAFGGVGQVSDDPRITGPANMGPAYPGAVPSIQDDPTGGLYDPNLGGLMAGAQRPRSDLTGSTYNPNFGALMHLAQSVIDQTGAVTGPANQGPNFNGVPGTYDDPNAGRPEGGIGNRNVMPGVYTDPNAARPPGGNGNPNIMPGVYVDPNAGRPPGGTGVANTPGMYLDPNTGRPEGGVGVRNAAVGPLYLKTGQEGQGYGSGGYAPSMVGPTLRTGQEGQGYGAGYTPSMVGPTLHTGSEGQGYSPAANPGTFVPPSLPTTVDTANVVDPRITQGLSQINGLGKEEIERRVASTGGLPPGLFFMPNGMLGFSGGSGSVNAMVGAWLSQVSQMNNAPPPLSHTGGNEQTAFNPDPGKRYDVTPSTNQGVEGSGFDVLGQRLPEPAPTRPDGTLASKDDILYHKSTGIWPWEVQTTSTGTPTPPKKVRR